MRVIAIFEKSRRIRHIGHLDIQRFVQRGLRRSGLPVAYSKGFSPHILVTFASALATGAWGDHEIMDVTMEQDVTPEKFIEEMNRSMPPEMQISWAKTVDDRHPAMMATLTAAEYEITVCDPSVTVALAEAIRKLPEMQEVTAVRKTKTGMKECNIRPLIHELSMEGEIIRCVMRLTEREACKPNMLLEALSRIAGLENVPRILVRRTGLLGEDPEGNRVPLETL